MKIQSVVIQIERGIPVAFQVPENVQVELIDMDSGDKKGDCAKDEAEGRTWYCLACRFAQTPHWHWLLDGPYQWDPPEGHGE